MFRKDRNRSPRFGSLAVCLTFLMTLLAPAPAEATLPPLTEIAIGRDARLPAGHGIGVALAVDEVSGIIPCTIVWVFDARTGMRAGAPLIVEIPRGITPVDVIYSQVFRPGSVLVLDSSLHVHELAIDFGRDGSPMLAGSAVHAIGNPDAYGMGTALEELRTGPPDDSKWLGVGTNAGNVIFARSCQASP